MDLTKQKIYDLKNFLVKNNIEYKEVATKDSLATLYFKSYSMTSRSYYNNKIHGDLGKIAFEMIKGFLAHINVSFNTNEYVISMEKQKLKSLLSKMDRTIRNRKVSVEFKKHVRFGGHSDSRKLIVVYEPEMESFDQYLKIVPGINYHELAHVLFTCSFKRLYEELKNDYLKYDPKFASYDPKKKKHLLKSVLRIFNVFEDGRAENLLGNKYGLAISYFKGTFYNFLYNSIKEKCDNGEEINEVDCALIVGRKYVDLDVRKWILNEYIKQNPDEYEEKAKRVNSYINKYIMLSWRKDRAEMKTLVLGFFFEFVLPRMEDAEKSQSQSSQSIDDMLEGMESSINNMDDDDIAEDIEDDSMGKLKKDMCDEANQEEAEVDGEAPDEKEVENKVEEEKQKAQQDIEDEKKNIEKKMGNMPFDIKENPNVSDEVVKPEMTKKRLQLEKKLKQYISKCRNGYVTRKKSGTVDVGEARRGEHKGSVKIFKRYRNNVKKMLDIDIAFVLDCSGSMNEYKRMTIASEQLWIASKACESVGATVKTFTFASQPLGELKTVKNNLAYKRPRATGGTHISSSLVLAEDYLRTSKRNNKWLIALTDGEIAPGDKALQIQMIEVMKRQHIVCGKINLDHADHDTSNIFDHVLNMEVKSDVNIVSFFENIYKIGLQRLKR
jgi:Mg-chelatase subunit ChlD